MAKILKVTGLTRVKSKFNRMNNMTPVQIENATRKWGEKSVGTILKGARGAGIRPFRSNGMFTSTRWVQNRNRGYMVMPMSGVHQDSARAHWVSTSPKNVMARAWAWRYLKVDGRIPGGFYFRPKPYFNQSFNIALKTFPVELGIAAKRIVEA